MASASSMPVRIGRWNNDPTDARTVFGFHGSTEPEVRITPSAPKASAQRITVPAFPGSRTCAQITSSWASADISPAEAQLPADCDDPLRGHGV